MNKVSLTANPRGRGPYNVACDACARKKTKCDGNKPVCQPCQSQGRQNECTWLKNSVRKPQTETYIDEMHKRNTDIWRYAIHLESLLDECPQCHHQNNNFRALRPPDPDVLLGQEDDSDVMIEVDDYDQGSDDGHNPTVMAICIPPQSLQVEPFTQPSRFPAVAENPYDTYVLFVDGVPQSHCDPNLDWSRHLPSYVPLDRPTHDRALDLLFKFYTSWTLRIVPALFLRDMNRALYTPPSQMPPKTPHYSPMLHNALVALALAFLDEPYNDFKRRQIYANTAKSFIEAECRKPNLSVVLALSVLCSFHIAHGDQTLGYMYFGMCARISQALGLHLDFSEWVKLGIMDEADRLDRHWASWSNFAQDVCWSLYVGRETTVAEPIGVKATPILHIDPKFDEMTWFHPPAQIPPQPNNLTKTFEATCRLLLIARRIMNVINGLNMSRSRALVLDNSINDIDARLYMWRDSLSEELAITTPMSRLTATPHKLMLHLAYWWLLILLHRPFFQYKSRPIQGTDSEIDHSKICRQAAEQIMELLSTWRALYKLRYCPVALIQTAFSAGTVYLLISMQAISGTRIARKELRHSLDQGTLVQQYLQEIEPSWNCAAIISLNLRNLMNEQVRPELEIMDRKYIPTTPGRHIYDDIGDDDEEMNVNNSAPQISDPHNMLAGSGQSSLSTLLNHVLTSSFPTPVPPPAKPLISPTITVSSTSDSPSTHANLNSLESTSSNLSSFANSWNVQNGPGSSSDINYVPSSSSHPDIRNYAQPFSNDPRFGNGNPPSAYLGMSGGQSVPIAPFAGSRAEDTHSSDFSNFVQSPSRTGFPTQESASTSLREHVPPPAHGGNDNLHLDIVLWRQPPFPL